MSQELDLDREVVDELARRAIQVVDPDMIRSPALQRLMQDIRGETDDTGRVSSAYNRMHNRHNRGR